MIYISALKGIETADNYVSNFIEWEEFRKKWLTVKEYLNSTKLKFVKRLLTYLGYIQNDRTCLLLQFYIIFVLQINLMFYDCILLGLVLNIQGSVRKIAKLKNSKSTAFISGFSSKKEK